ncbi:succinate dehydrogenase, hydrophobic membrane anchor protein [Methylophilaceae bacterium]|nr:succinate dehydrogenase, hydrophobic membrane anchor protein [Methylophilaceae bacterium]
MNNFKKPFGGMTQWLYQRFTALFMVTYMGTLSVIIFSSEPITFDVWSSLFGSWVIRHSTLVFFYVMFFHAWIGILHVTEDYIKIIYLRNTVNLLFLILMFLQLIYLTYFLIGYRYD